MGSSVIATPSPAPSGAVSDKTKTSPAVLVPAGTAFGPGFSTHASQALPDGGAGRRTTRYGGAPSGVTTAARAAGVLAPGARGAPRPPPAPAKLRRYVSHFCRVVRLIAATATRT